MDSLFATTFMIWAFIAAGTTFGMGYLFNKKALVWQSISMFVVFYIISWFLLPPIAIDMLGSWSLFLTITIIAAFFTIISTQDESGDISIKSATVPLFIGIMMLCGMFFTSGVFNATRMASIITVTDHGQKDTAMALASQDQALRVTPNLALKRAAELLGSAEQAGLGSIAKYGTMYGNVTPEGKAVWVSPLEHTNFFRWLSNDTTPGYFVASHVNVMDSRLVQDQPIAYGTSGFFFGKDLSRHLYINGYVNYRYGDTFFQIDDKGIPHYVVPMERPQVGFWSYFPEKWAIVNATTGEITEAKSHDELPSWVDRGYSLDIIENRLSDWGCFSKGAWACYISGVEVVDPTPGMVVTMGANNEMIYYTGTQFHNNKAEGATSGVATVNSRTGKVEFYRRAGITETAAVAIIDGAVANYAGRGAEDPVLIQINGLETYFAVITDASGAKKGYGMVWQRNRDAYGIGNSVEEAVRNYLRSVRNIDKMAAFEGNREIEPVVFKGLVVVITPISRDGETAFYLRIDTVDDKVFTVNTANLSEVATTKAGDPVVLSTFNPKPGTIEVDTFDNLLISLAHSERQVKLTKDTEAVMKRYREKTDKNNANAKLRELSPEQVRKLLEALKQ